MKNKAFGIIPSEKQRKRKNEKELRKLKGLMRHMRRNNICTMGIPEGEKKKGKKVYLKQNWLKNSQT